MWLVPDKQPCLMEDRSGERSKRTSKGERVKKEEKIMAYVITDECVSCGTCAGECPVEAISEGDSKYVIDADTCVECGTCASVCPTEAIVEE